MAPKRPIPLKEQPLASSSSEEESDREEEEEVPETDQEEEVVSQKPGTEDDDEETDSDEEEEAPEKTGGEDDEEETDSEEEDEVPEKPGGEDEEEEEDFVAAQKNIQKPLPSSAAKSQKESESDSKLETVAKPDAKSTSSKPTQNESETESESDSVSEPEMPKAVSELNVKPISLKSKDLRNKGKAGTSSLKRGAEADGDGKETKRYKVDVGEKSSNDVKKQLFQRLWSEEDEVAVLQGMINFAEKNGINVTKGMASFHEFIKKYLHIDVSFSQLKDKVARLKKKFENNRKARIGGGKIFNKGNDQKIFDLSKRIWGSEVAVSAFGDSAFRSNGKVKAKEEANAGVGISSLRMESMYFDMSSDYVMRKGAELMQGAKKAEMDERLRQIHVEELKLFLKRNELIREYTNVVLDAYENRMDKDN